MNILINSVVPDFTAQTTQGLISFHQWMGQSWTVFFSHPKAFTPVCTTELMALTRLRQEWEKRNTQLIGLSVDSVELDQQWLDDISAHLGQAVPYPVIADIDHRISTVYSMLPHTEYAPAIGQKTQRDYSNTRAVFIIDPDKRLRLSMSYPPEVGRDFGEILRVLDALQLADGQQVETPANWRPGEKVLVPSTVSTPQAEQQFGTVESELAYLRWIKAKPLDSTR